MNFWRAIFLAAFLLGVALGVVLALIALHTGLFFGTLTVPAHPGKTDAVQHAVYHFLGEKLQADVAGVTFLDKILVEAHALCPNQMGGK